ncbi:MAG: UDP-N-acetylmuramoyl-L-alanine--D-glutamate ligase [Gemmiger sp.]|nr:UDP-N-acetylmuramoyl-L-alanine--D-glutamate ligase [Gemmiger sp.]
MLPVERLQALVQGKKVALIGAGVSHKPCIEQLVGLGAKVTLCDQKETLADFGEYADTLRRLQVNLCLGKGYTEGFRGQDIILRTPGYEFYQPALQAALAAGTMVTSEVELFFELCPCELVAVTGSDGKTTTTSLIAAMYRAAGRRVFLGGNIGAALLPQLPEVTPGDVAVVELSSFQLISMKTSPRVAVVTNVTPNHLDHHKDMQEYIDAKRNILRWQTPPCRAVLGFENEISRGMQADCKGQQVWFTRLHDTDNGAFLRASDDTLCYAEPGADGVKVTPVLPRAEVKLRGLHNVENLLAAIAAVWGQVPLAVMRQVGASFTGVEHRIEPVRTLDGVQYYNDSIASSPTRVIAGLRSFDQKIILIAGGYDKKIPYEPLAPEILQHVKVLVLMGATGPRIEKAVREHPDFAAAAPGLKILHAAGMAEAVALARANAVAGDIVSLSPASASFDLYPNFEVRGRDYKRIVNELV